MNFYCYEPNGNLRVSFRAPFFFRRRRRRRRRRRPSRSSLGPSADGILFLLKKSDGKNKVMFKKRARTDPIAVMRR